MTYAAQDSALPCGRTGVVCHATSAVNLSLMNEEDVLSNWCISDRRPDCNTGTAEPWTYLHVLMSSPMQVSANSAIDATPLFNDAGMCNEYHQTINVLFQATHQFRTLKSSTAQRQLVRTHVYSIACGALRLQASFEQQTKGA